MEIYFVTGNKSKYEEAKNILGKAGINVVQFDMKFNEPKTLDQKAVLLEKAKQAYAKLKRPLIVDDTAIYFHAYSDFPGAITKDLMERLGYEGINALLKGLKKGAHFKTMVCLTNGKDFQIFQGIWNGTILEKPAGKKNRDWTYDNVFVPKGYNVPLSKVPLDERAKKSHRRKALLNLERYLEGRV